MSAGHAVFSGWMEIAEKAVYEEARKRAEEQALTGLVSQYAGTLYRVAYSVLRNSADAEDAVQEAFVRVLPAGGLTAEERVAATQHHARVLACVEQLPAKERQVLMLSAFEELTSVEIASVLGITESSVRSRLFRARNLMAGLMEHTRSLR